MDKILFDFEGKGLEAPATVEDANELLHIIQSHFYDQILKSAAHHKLLKFKNLPPNHPQYYWTVQETDDETRKVLQRSIRYGFLPEFVHHVHDGVVLSLPGKYKHAQQHWEIEAYSDDVVKSYIESTSSAVCSQHDRFEKTLATYEQFTLALKYKGYSVLPRKYVESILSVSPKAFRRTVFLCRYKDVSFAMKVFQADREYTKRIFTSPFCPVEIFSEIVMTNALSNLRTFCPSFPILSHAFQIEHKNVTPETNVLMVTELWKKSLCDCKHMEEPQVRQIVFQVVHTLFLMQKYLRAIHGNLVVSNILLRDKCPTETRYYAAGRNFYKVDVDVPCILSDFGMAFSEVIFDNSLESYCRARCIRIKSPLGFLDLLTFLESFHNRCREKKFLKQVLEFVKTEAVERTRFMFGNLFGDAPVFSEMGLFPDEMFALDPSFLAKVLDKFFDDFKVPFLPSSVDLVYGDAEEFKRFVPEDNDPDAPPGFFSLPKPNMELAFVHQLPPAFNQFPKRQFEIDLYNYTDIVQRECQSWSSLLHPFFSTPREHIYNTMVGLYHRFGRVCYHGHLPVMAALVHLMDPDKNIPAMSLERLATPSQLQFLTFFANS